MKLTTKPALTKTLSQKRAEREAAETAETARALCAEIDTYYAAKAAMATAKERILNLK